MKSRDSYAAKGFHVFVGARNAKAGRKAAEDIAKKCGKATFLEIDVADNDSVATATREFSNIEDYLMSREQCRDHSRRRRCKFGNQRRPVSKDAGDEYARPAACDPRVRAVTPEKQSAARDQCLEQRRSTHRRRGWLGAGVLHFKDCAEWRDSAVAAALPKFAVNSVCPGWVRTEMGGKNANRSVEEGADTIVWLASEAAQDLTGKFLRDRKEIPW